MHPTRRTRIHPKGLQSPLEGQDHGETGANKGSICRYNMLDSLLKASPLRARERGPQPTAWKGNSTKLDFRVTEFSEVVAAPVQCLWASRTDATGCYLPRRTGAIGLMDKPSVDKTSNRSDWCVDM